MSRRCAFLTTDDLGGFVTDDELAHEPFRRLGWEVEPVPWRRLADPDRFEAVVIRTPWDYPDDPDLFLAVLERIDGSGARLANPLGLVRWNLRKTYLGELEERGVPVVPTVFRHAIDRRGLRRLFDELESDRLVVKPLVGANARDVHVIGRGADDPALSPAEEAHRGRDCLIQPFVTSVTDEGEYSLIFLGGRHSHTIRKLPREGDFRAQEEHGARLSTVEDRADLVTAGDRALAAIDPTPLYARVDLVRLRCGDLAVMELELVEPSLYLRMDPSAPERFAAAFHRWMEEGRQPAGPASR